MVKVGARSIPSANDVQYRRAKTWHIAFASLTSGSSMAFYTLITMISYLANEGYGIAVALAGFILTATRIVDGVIAPFIAIVIDKFNSRFGKIRLFLTLGWFIRSVAVLMLYVWGSGKGHGVLMFIAIYLVYILGSAIADTAGNVIAPIMTNDPQQRPMVNVWGTIYSYIFPTIFSLIATLVILPIYGNRYSVPMLATTCIVFVLISLVFHFLSFIGIAPIDKPENFSGISDRKENAVKASDMVKLVKNNRPFQMYIIGAAAEKLALVTGSQAVVTTMLFGILIGNIQFGTILSMASMLPAMIFAIVGGKYAGRHGSRKATITWTSISIVLAVANIVFCFLVDMASIPASGLLTGVFFVLLLLLNGGKMCVTAASGAMRADIIDYELDRSGKYMPAVVTATYNFIDKLITSLGSTVAAGFVSLIGYTSIMPQPTDASSVPLFLVTIFLFFGLPILGWLASLIAMRFNKLTKAEMVEVQKRIHEQKQSVAQMADKLH